MIIVYIDKKKIGSMYDPLQDDPKEVQAKKYDLSYIALDGTIGCLVNGAGLAMATMDIIKHVGGSPANFLDIGGSATKEKVSQALKIILNDNSVKAIFINVFGGIVKCDIIVNGVVAVATELNINIPLVVRLDGTNVDLGKKILKNSNLKIITADDMLDGAQKAVDSTRR